MDITTISEFINEFSYLLGVSTCLTDGEAETIETIFTNDFTNYVVFNNIDDGEEGDSYHIKHLCNGIEIGETINFGGDSFDNEITKEGEDLLISGLTILLEIRRRK